MHKENINIFISSLCLCFVGAILFAFHVSLALALVHCVLGGIGLCVSLRRGVSSLLQSPFRMLSVFLALGCFLALYGVGNLMNIEIDLSADSKFSLSPGTKRELSALRTPIILYHVRFGEVTHLEQESELVERFVHASPQLSVRNVDPVYDVALIEELAIKTGDRVIVARSGKETVRLKDVSEQSLALAVARLAEQRALTVLYSIGHGEPALQSGGPLGVSRMGDLLLSEGASVREYSLLQQGLPTNASALFLMVAPEKELAEDEEALLIQFVENGGNILLVTEGTTRLPEVFQREGLSMLQSPALRVSRDESGEERFTYDLPITLYRTHPSTMFLEGEASVLFSRAYPISITNQMSDRLRYREELLRYGNGGSAARPAAAGPQSQSLLLGMALEANNGARLQLVGDSSWVRNRLIDKAYNEELLRGSLLWGGHVDIASVELTPAPRVPLSSVSPAVMNQLMLIFLVIGEGLLLIAFLVFWQRRRRAVGSRMEAFG